MKLGNFKFYLQICFFVLYNFSVFAEDQVLSTPLINLNELKPSFEDIEEINEDRSSSEIIKYKKKDTLKTNLSSAKFIGLDKNIITKFSTNQKRVQNRKQLISCIQQKVSQINSTSFFNNCLKLNIPVGRIKTMDNVFDNPVAKEMILKEKIGNQETKRIASIAFTITC